MRKFLIVLAMVAMASFLLVGCNTGTTPETPVTPVEPELQLTGITVAPKTMDLFGVGDSDTIDSVTANYELKGYGVDVDFNDCLFLTSDSKVATVKYDNIADKVTVTAVAKGTADILVSYEGKMDIVKVTVKGLLVVVPHSTQNGINKAAGKHYILWKIDGPCIEFTFVNPTATYTCFEYRVDGEAGVIDEWTDVPIGGTGELAGQWRGLLYNAVNLDNRPGYGGIYPGAMVKTVQVCAEKEVWVGSRRGGEQNWYIDWIKFEAK